MQLRNVRGSAKNLQKNLIFKEISDQKTTILIWIKGGFDTLASRALNHQSTIIHIGGETMENTWSEGLINKTREMAGDGCMLKNHNREHGFYFSTPGGNIEIRGISEKTTFPVPTKEVIATFSDIEEMIAADWVVD